MTKNDSLQQAFIRIDSLQSYVGVLKHQVDSLKNAQVLDQVKYRAIEHQEVVNQVSDFYENSWNKLLFMLALLGVLVPIIIQWFQNRSLKQYEKSVVEKVTVKINAKIEELKVENEKKFSKLEKTATVKIKRVEAQVLVTSAKGLNDQKNHEGGAFLLLQAALIRNEVDEPKTATTILQEMRDIIKDFTSDEKSFFKGLMKRSSLKKDFEGHLDHFNTSKHSAYYIEVIKEITAKWTTEE